MTYTSIRPGQVWLDTEGKRIQAHGGSIIYVDDTYYWYGENKEKTTGENNIWHWGVKCYSSKDLYNWKDEGIIIPPDLEDEHSPLHPSAQMDRPHIIYNKDTKKYVCWLKIMHKDETQSETILTADHILGPYVREAPAHFYRKGLHYIVTSGTTGYFPNPSEIACSKCYHGPFEVLGNPHVDDPSHTSFHSQICSVFKVPGKKDLYIALADRWLPQMMDSKYEDVAKLFEAMFNPDSPKPDFDGEAQNLNHTAIADYVWLPFRFDGKMAYLDWKDEWRIEDYE